MHTLYHACGAPVLVDQVWRDEADAPITVYRETADAQVITDCPRCAVPLVAADCADARPVITERGALALLALLTPFERDTLLAAIGEIEP